MLLDPYRSGIVKIIGWLLGGLLALMYGLDWYRTGVFPL